MHREPRKPRALLIILALALSAHAAVAAPVSEGRKILAVTVYGNGKTATDLIVRTLGIEPGERYNREQVLEGIARVKELAGIRYVTHRAVPVAGGRGVYLALTVTEERTWSVRPRMTRNFADRIALGGAAEERNLRGLNERLYLSVLVRAANIIDLEWSKHDFSAFPQAGIGLCFEYSRYRWPWPSFPSLKDEDDPIERFDACAMGTLRLGGGVSLSIAPGVSIIGKSRYEGYGDEVSEAPEGTFTTLEIGIRYENARRMFYPRSGLLASVSAKRWGIFNGDSGLEMTRFRLEAAAFEGLGPLWPALRITGAYTGDSPPYYLYEHIGGVSTVRGFERGAFYGENSIVARFDLRIPLNFEHIEDLGNPVILAALDLFSDTGAAWNGKDIPVEKDFHSGAGAALDLIPKEGWLLRTGRAWAMDGSGRWFIDVGKDF